MSCTVLEGHFLTLMRMNLLLFLEFACKFGLMIQILKLMKKDGRLMLSVLTEH